jgi:hypothetical protein
MKQQLLVINRSRRRAPNLSALDRFLFGFWSLFLSPLHYHPHPDDNGPSWLAFIGHAKDSLWSIDLFRCESILLKTHWAVLQSTT